MKPDILADVFLSNEWDPASQSLQPVKQAAFRLRQGQNNSLNVEGSIGENMRLIMSNDSNNANFVQFQLVKDSGVKIWVNGFEASVPDGEYLRLGLLAHLLPR